MLEGRRRLRGFIVATTGTCYTLVVLAARIAAPQGRLTGTMAALDVAALLVIVAVAASRSA